MEYQGVWYKSKKGWVSAVLAAVYFVLDHWGRAEVAHDIYVALAPAKKLFPLISSWIPLVLFLAAIGFFEAERRKRPKQAKSALPVSSAPLSTQPSSLPAAVPVATARTRIIADVTPQYLIGLFKSGQTSIQAGKLVEAFIGKWIPVSGPVQDVAAITAIIRQLTFADRSIFQDNQVYMYFDATEWGDQLSILRPGDNVKALGQIRDVDNVGVRLDNCELVDS